MRTLIPLLLMGLTTISPGNAAETLVPSQQDHQSLITLAREFLTQHAQSMSAEAEIRVSPPNQQLRLPYCAAPQAFLPATTKLWGHMNVGIRCQQGATWQVYLQADLKIKSRYVVSKQALPAGRLLQAEDLQWVDGELPAFSSGVLLKSEQVIGKTLTMPIASGVLFRQDILKSPTLIAQGQSVKVVSKGQGFEISTEGIALNQASLGQLVRAKVGSGQVVQGYAAESGQIEIK